MRDDAKIAGLYVEFPDRIMLRFENGRSRVISATERLKIIAALNTLEISDGLRVPLHSLQADLDYLFARLDECPEVRATIKDSIRDRLAQIEEASDALQSRLETLDKISDLWFAANEKLGSPSEGPLAFLQSHLDAAMKVIEPFAEIAEQMKKAESEGLSAGKALWYSDIGFAALYAAAQFIRDSAAKEG